MESDAPLYLVGLPEGEMIAPALQRQREMAEQYRLYSQEPLPPLHLTLATMDNPGRHMSKIIEEVEKISQRTAPIPISVSGISCFGPPALAVAFYVERNPALELITTKLQAAITRAGGLLKPKVEDWAYHITLSSAATADQPWDESTHGRACYGLSFQHLRLKGRISAVALWFPEFRPLAEVAGFSMGG